MKLNDLLKRYSVKAYKCNQGERLERLSNQNSNITVWVSQGGAF